MKTISRSVPVPAVPCFHDDSPGACLSIAGGQLGPQLAPAPRGGAREDFPRDSFAAATDAPPAPGSEQQYNGLNSFVLDLIVEKATGHSFINERRRRIIRPLHLRHPSLPAADNPTIPSPHAEVSPALVRRDGVRLLARPARPESGNADLLQHGHERRAVYPLTCGDDQGQRVATAVGTQIERRRPRCRGQVRQRQGRAVALAPRRTPGRRAQRTASGPGGTGPAASPPIRC
ncbi:serine hydrolase [Streptomyces angustmyceticus]|uniref:serine hydrolase n=1 Tax=Streptomyces angustmyceticus TaxID=285578 RepID=UPI00381F92E3